MGLGRFLLVGSVHLCVFALAGCSAGNFFEEREPWRLEAEVQCIDAGTVKESAGIVRVEAIRGPGVCGADYPLRVSALGASMPLGYAGELRPPTAIPGAAAASQPRWPIIKPGEAPVAREELAPLYEASPTTPRSDFSPQRYESRPLIDGTGGLRAPPVAHTRASLRELSPAVPLGPNHNPQVTGAVGPVAVKPAATLACPMVSELERWIAGSVQPAAMRWFGMPVVEIKQISAYSCRGMNGNPRARISEHAFGNALDIASFTLADGHIITVKNGWNGLPEEQGFLRDIQGAACDQFNTVLAPGSNVFHYDHIHVDLMRRRSGDRACNPGPVAGEEIAARAGARYAKRGGDPFATGALAGRGAPPKRLHAQGERRERALPMAEPGDDGEDDD